MILVVRLLDRRGLYYPRTYPLGLVEVRNPRADTRAECEAIRQSSVAFGDEEPDRCMRMATLVDSGGLYEAHRIAEERFEEALDVLAPEGGGLSSPALIDAGFALHLQTGRIEARTPRQPQPGFGARMMREQFPQCDWPQFLLTNQTSELSQRLIRSYHWSRKAQLEANRQLRVLFRWFAMEAIWMLSKNDDIVPRLLWALGFPNGAGAALLSPAFVKALGDHPTIGTWKKQIEDRFLAMKTLRNDSVHSGFRRQDTPPETLREFDEITTLACARVQSCARAGVLAKLGSAAELFEYLPVLAESDPRYIEDVHGNILFGLENPMPRLWRSSGSPTAG